MREFCRAWPSPSPRRASRRRRSASTAAPCNSTGASSGAHYGLAFRLKAKGDLPEAAQHLRAFLARPPKGPDADRWVQHAEGRVTGNRDGSGLGVFVRQLRTTSRRCSVCWPAAMLTEHEQWGDRHPGAGAGRCRGRAGRYSHPGGPGAGQERQCGQRAGLLAHDGSDPADDGGLDRAAHHRQPDRGGRSTGLRGEPALSAHHDHRPFPIRYPRASSAPTR